MTVSDATPVLPYFGLDKRGVALEREAGGYINDTFRVLVQDTPAYILQRINTEVFPAARQVMENLQLMLPYLEGPGYTGLKLEPTKEGAPWLETEGGEIWRMFHFIPGSGTLEHTDDGGISREAGRVLGRFHRLAANAAPGRLHTPLPRFHDLAWRAEQLEKALEQGLQDRAGEAADARDLSRELIAFCLEIPLSGLALRICHNDPKLSNILFDLPSGHAHCLIDLDTLMPGYLLYDFGDAARTLLNPLPETSRDRDAIRVELPMFEAFVAGWKSSGFRAEAEETRWLAHGVVLMPTLHGIRALADHLLGDRYYQVAYPGQNLVRAKNLLGFAEKARKHLPEMQGILAALES